MRKAAGWLALLLLASCSTGAPDHVPIDPALSTLVAPDTVLLAGIRVDDLQSSAGFESLLAATAPESLWQLIEDTQLDAAKDLWEILYASNGTDGVLMARGRFSESGLEPRFDREGARRMPYRGYMMIGDENQAVLFMNATTALMAATSVLESIVDSRGSYRGIPDELAARINSIEPDSQVWAVSTGQWHRSQMGSGAWSNMFGVLSRVEGLTARVIANDAFSLLVQADCPSDEEAEELLGSANALIALARFGAAESPAAMALLAGVGVARTGRSVQLSGELSSEDLVKVLEEAPAPEFN